MGLNARNKPRKAQAAISGVASGTNNIAGPLTLDAGQVMSVSLISASFSGTMQLQRRLPQQTTWQPVPCDGVAYASLGITTAFEGRYTADERQEVQFACSAFTSGAATARIGTGAS